MNDVYFFVAEQLKKPYQEVKKILSGKKILNVNEAIDYVLCYEYPHDKQKIINTVKNNIKRVVTVNKFDDIFGKQIQHTVLYLDTNYQVFPPEQYGKLKWYLSSSTVEDYSIGPNGACSGMINIKKPIKNIIGMRIGNYDLLRGMYHTIGLTNMHHFDLCVEELKQQGFIANNRYNHFFFSRTYEPVSPNDELSTHGHNDGYFWFNKPIQYLDSVTLSLGYRGAEMPFYNNEFHGVLVQNSNPMQVNMDIVGTGTYCQLENVTIYGFTTGDPVTDASLINSVNGISRVSLYSGYMTFAIDISTMTPSSEEIHIMLKINRLIFNLELIHN